MTLSINQKWNAYLGMTKRNMLLFFKDKSTIFFSMLAPLIVLGLYILFLKNIYVDSILNNAEALNGLVNEKDIDVLANFWLLSGILGTSSITVALNSLSIMVEDKAKKIDFDYNSTPLGGGIVTLAYFTGAFINTFLITTVILSVGLVALSLMGTTYLSAVSVLSLYGVNALGCASATIMMMIIVSFFKKPSALGAFSGIVSAVVGFIIGAYIPLGSFSTGVQSILSIVPGSHIACLYRNILMSGVLENINMSINGVDGGVFVSGLKELFAVNLNFASWNLAALVNILYVSISSVIFLITTILLYRLSNKR